MFRLRVGGLLWMAPVCSSFVFANVSNTKRSVENPVGDVSYEAVAVGNLMANAAAFLFDVAVSRQVQVAMENPVSSLIYRYPPIVQVLKEVRAQFFITDSCPYSDKCYGHRFLKAFKIAATGNWMHRVVRKCKCPDGEHIALMRRDENGGVSGTKALKESQAYPARFGAAVVAAWLAGDLPAGSEELKVKPTAKPSKRPVAPSSWSKPQREPLPPSKKVSKGNDDKFKRARPSTSWMKPTQ